MTDPIIVAAIEYARRGWSVLPMKADKTPCVRWKARQTERVAPEAVAAWFGRLQTCVGVGVVLGAISGHLACRDFDCADAYARWAEAFPTLAKALPTAQTARGCHVYFRHRGVQTKHLSDGELRGESHYMVLPPSPHPKGVVYSWLVPLPEGEVPEVDPELAGLSREWLAAHPPDCATERTEETEESDESKDTQDTEDTHESDAIAGVWIKENSEAIEAAIGRTLPPTHGKRNIHVFRFCRALRAIPELRKITGAKLRILKPIVREWHRRALPNIWTKDFGTTWGEFAYGWDRVKFPEGEGTLTNAFERAKASEPPAWVVEYDEPRILLLGSLCRELQTLAGAEEFFLSVRSIQRLLGVDIGTASRWLAAFVADGALVLGEKGTQRTGKASRWRYVAAEAGTESNGKEAG